MRIRKPNGSVIYVDGYYPGPGNPAPQINEIVRQIPTGARAYQYNGCLFHACKSCFKNNRHLILFNSNGLSYDEVYAKTLNDIQVLKDLGLEGHNVGA